MEWSELQPDQAAQERHHELAGPIADRRWRERQDQVRRSKNWWWWLFFWLMPVGFLAPCLLAIVLNNKDYSPVAALAAILLPFVGLGGIMLMGGDSQSYKYMIGMYDKATELNLTYAPESTDTYWAKFLKKCLVYQNIRGKFVIGNSLFGNYHGIDVLLITWVAETDDGVSYSSVLIIPDSGVGPAEFVVLKRAHSWFAQMTEWFKGQPEIEASQLEEFTKNFAIVLHSPDKESILKMLTPKFINICQTYSDYAVELRSGHLLINKPTDMLKPEHIQEYLHAGLEFLLALQRE
jgi:hypothetical protein